MTIKQQGGIFGRNPTFNDVDAETINVTDISLPDAGEASFGASNDLKIYHDGSNSYVQEAGVGSLLIYGSNMRLGNSDGSKLYLLANSGDKTDIYFDGAVKIRTQSTGAQIFGDLAFSAGNGIDFSATSGTGTSELFDDYEEGTWTPTVAGSTTAGDYTVTPTGAVYTKVGRFVHASAYFLINENSAGTGSLLIGGLPFSSLANSRISGSFLSTNATFDALCVYAIPAQSTGGATTVVTIKQVRSTTSPLNLPVTALAATSIVELHVNYTTS